MIILSALLIVVSIYALANGETSFPVFAGLLLGSFFLFLGINQKKLDEWIDRSNHELQRKLSFCKFHENHVFFPKGYYFKHGYLKDAKELPYTMMEEIRINTFPPCAKINGNELIYFPGKNKAELEALARQKDIPISTAQDNWSLICEDYLDSEPDDYLRSRIDSQLADAGFSSEELRKIRRKIGWRMLALTYVSLEWVYYGHYDVLQQLRPMRSKTYWWTMEIALRENKNVVRTN